MTRMPMPEEIEALKKALTDALGELRVVRTERDLLKEQLNRFKRQLFDAKSEVSAAHQKDLFFNEAEVEGAQAQPATEEREDDKLEVPAHKRKKRGRKPLDPALPREVVRYELPENERLCPHDGDVTALEQPVQLLHRQCRHGVGSRPYEAILLQAFEQQPVAVAIPAEDLHAVAPSVAEHVGARRERIQAQRLLHQ